MCIAQMFPAVPTIASRPLRDLLWLWSASRHDHDDIPRKSDLDPIALGRLGLMPYLWLMRRDGDDFVYALCGEEIRRNFPVTIKNRRVSDVFSGDQADLVLESYRAVAETPAIEYTEGPVKGSRAQMYVASRLMLPLADAEGRVTHVLGCVEKQELGSIRGTDTVPEFGLTRRIQTPVEKVPFESFNGLRRTADISPAARPWGAPAARFN
jgi:hypothetical protein